MALKKPDAVSDVLKRLVHAKRAKEAAQAAWEAAETDYIRLLGDVQTSSTRAVDEDGYITRVTGTVVRGVRVIIDEARLKKELGATEYNRNCKLVLDKSKLEDSIVRGKVDPVTVAMCSEEVPNKVYVKITEKREFSRSRKAVKKR